MADRPASRAALLALRRERRVIEEGHRFLDEKRIALAQELLRQSRAYRDAAAASANLAVAARRAYAQAIERHGLEGVQVYPETPFATTQLQMCTRSFLGLPLVDEAHLRVAPNAPRKPPEMGSAEGERCATAWRALVDAAPGLAAAVANLLRLMAEYQRTERRVRALENIILPEVKQEERRLQSVLEELDQEDVIRARVFAGRVGARDGGQ